MGKLLRTTAFKLSMAYLAVFALFALVVLGYVAWSTRSILDAEIAGTIDAEINGLSDQYRQGGLRQLVTAVERRAAQPGASLYLVTTHAGEKLAGNVARLPDGVLDTAGGVETDYQRTYDPDGRPGRAIARVFVLPGGFRLLVGRDVDERDRLRVVIKRAFGSALALIVALGTLGGLFVARRVLARVDAMTDTTQRIMAGDFEGRLPVAGNDDELDRLAHNLNAMLDRIGELMIGLQQVSDNIAHDLKTPLTRLRNHAEDALRTAREPEDYRKALEGAIDESDGLIRVFNALLTIARLEAGNSDATMSAFDVGEVARSLAELYEPMAEEAGLGVHVDVASPLMLEGNRELIGQALANLLDNAIKYGQRNDANDSRDGIAVSARAVADGVEIAVADHGPGIPASEREHVTERFVRLEGSRSKPGFGLGLSLVAAVAKLHHGRLRLEDNAPGLKAVLVLPARQPASIAGA